MKKTILLLVAISGFSVSYSLSSSAHKYYKKRNNYFFSGKYQKAIEYYSTSIQLYPSADAYYNRALAYFKLGDSCDFFAVT